MELGGDVVKGIFLGKDLRGKLELSRLMAVKTGFGGQSREEVISKSKMDLQIPRMKRNMAQVSRTGEELVGFSMCL